MTRVAVAVVHYHAEALLEECLARLGASSLTDFRAVVVDNGSSASVGGYLSDPRIELVTAPHNLGFAAGVNRALEELPPDAPYLLLLNPDVQLETDTIETLVAALETEPGVGAASCALRLLDGNLDPACRRAEPTAFSALAKQLGLHRLMPSSPLFGRYNLVGVDAGEPHDIDSGTGALLLIRRDALDQAGGRLDERFFLYGEDLDLCRRLREAGHRIRFYPQASALHAEGLRQDPPGQRHQPLLPRDVGLLSQVGPVPGKSSDSRRSRGGVAGPRRPGDPAQRHSSALRVPDRFVKLVLDGRPAFGGIHRVVRGLVDGLRTGFEPWDLEMIGDNGGNPVTLDHRLTPLRRVLRPLLGNARRVVADQIGLRMAARRAAPDLVHSPHGVVPLASAAAVDRQSVGSQPDQSRVRLRPAADAPVPLVVLPPGGRSMRITSSFRPTRSATT